MSRITKCSQTLLTVVLWLLFSQTGVAEWKQQSSGTLAWLRSVFFVDVNHGWIAGSNGTLLVTSDGGQTWQKAKKFTGDNIWDVYFSDTKNGWLLCERDIYSARSPHSYLLQTRDGGSNWERVEFSDSRDRIVRFFFTKDGYGTAVGEGGAIWQMLDDKKTWKRKELPSQALVLAGAFVDDFNGVLVGGAGKVLATSDGGVEWSNAAVPAGSSTRLNSVFFVDKKTGWIAGAEGKVYVTRNGGKVWQEQASGVNEDLSDIFFVDKHAGYVVGDKGRIIETKTGGDSWTAVDTGVNGKLESVFFTGRNGFAVGFGGLILNYRPSDKAGDASGSH